MKYALKYLRWRPTDDGRKRYRIVFNGYSGDASQSALGKTYTKSGTPPPPGDIGALGPLILEQFPSAKIAWDTLYMSDADWAVLEMLAEGSTRQ